MGRIKCKCLDKLREPSGKIIGYRLRDMNGQEIVLQHAEVKKRLLNKSLIITNLQLSSDGRIIDKEELMEITDIPAMINFQKNSGLAPLIGINQIGRDILEIKQCYENIGGSGDVWTSVKEEYITTVTYDEHQNISSTTVSDIQEDGSDQPLTHKRTKIERCRKVPATEMNVMKYVLVWMQRNRYGFTKVPKQAGLMEQMLSDQNVPAEHKEEVRQIEQDRGANMQTKLPKDAMGSRNNAFDKMKARVESRYKIRKYIPAWLDKDISEYNKDYIIVEAKDDRENMNIDDIAILADMRYIEIERPNVAAPGGTIWGVNKINSLDELNALLKRCRLKEDNAERLVDLLYSNYKKEYARVYAETNNIDDINLVTIKDINTLLKEDLEDKSFNEAEINEILESDSVHMKKNTYYKLGAYLISLYNYPETFDELKTLANELCKDYKVNDLDEEDLKKIWDKYRELD